MAAMPPISATTTDVSSAGALQELLGRARGLLFRRVWLPKGIYAAVPVLYLAIGALAMWVAWRFPGWGWVHWYCTVIGIGCITVGLRIIQLRRRYRAQQRLMEPAAPLAG